MYLVWIKNPILATWKLWNKVFWREHPSGQLKLPLLVRREAVVIAVLLFSLFFAASYADISFGYSKKWYYKTWYEIKNSIEKECKGSGQISFLIFLFHWVGGGGVTIFKSKCWESIKVGIHIVFLEREIICLHGL